MQGLQVHGSSTECKGCRYTEAQRIAEPYYLLFRDSVCRDRRRALGVVHSALKVTDSLTQ